jgi:hypothetical protein
MSTFKLQYLHEIHQEHRIWIKELEFAEDELTVFLRRLEEVVLNNNKIELLAEAQLFQNQLLKRQEVIAQLKLDVKSEEQKIVEMAESNAIAPERKKTNISKDLVLRMEMFTTLWSELKANFITYLT